MAVDGPQNAVIGAAKASMSSKDFKLERGMIYGRGFKMHKRPLASFDYNINTSHVQNTAAVSRTAYDQDSRTAYNHNQRRRTRHSIGIIVWG